ncbi:MAG: long-chain fatty acid--CoA ligase [Cytophagaceae bacterium]|nr:long-chain fatty acid--CoA ligase [Cytophagaceae bacterium]
MNVTRVFDLLPHQLESFPQDIMFSMKVKGEWKGHSTQEVKKIADELGLGFLKLGLKKDDKVAIISANRVEWNFIDYAVQQLGVVSVPMYPTITEEDYRYIFQDAGVKVVFVSNEELYQKVSRAIEGISSIQAVYSFEQITGVKHWTEVQQLGNAGNVADLETYKAAVKSDDLLTLIYTSGTTGNPKGVMLTHNNIISNFKVCAHYMPVDHNHRALSFLPLCHVYERMLNYLYAYCGVSIYYAESIETISDNLKEVHPHIFVSVPRLLEKVFDKINAKGEELTGIKKKLFFWAKNLGLRYDLSNDLGWWYNIQLKVANKLIFNKWREALGGEVRAVVSGGAALQPRLARVFWAAQIPILEGYGLTETSPVIAVNRCEMKDNRVGTVGPLIDGVEVKFAEDGEILTRGPHVMKGYYNKPDLTKEAITADGWFHTGDIGEFVEGRFLKITDRKKEMFKTSGGKYIAPQSMENKFKESRYVEQVMVLGDGRKFPAALIVPSFENVKSWCAIKGIPYTTDEEMIKNPKVLEKFQRELEEFNEHFAQYERVKKFGLLVKIWSIEGGELTAKLSLKRKVILEKYKDQVEEMYKE